MRGSLIKLLRATGVWVLLPILGLIPFKGVYSQATTVDLVVSKTAPTSALNNSEIVYKLKFSNNGPADADGATFSDLLPAGLSILDARCVAGSEVNGAVCPDITTSGQMVSGVLPTFPNSGQVSVEIRARLPARGANSYENTATITPPEGRTETNATTNQSKSNTSITYQDIDLKANIVSAPASVTVGESVAYEIEYENLGPGPSAISDSIQFSMNSAFGASTTATHVTIGNIQIACEASGGAVCPGFVNPPPESQSIIFNLNNARFNQLVPAWPAGGKLKITYGFRVVDIAGAVCGAVAKNRGFNATASVAAGAGSPVDVNLSNNTTANVTSAGTPVPIPPCPPVDLAVTKSQSESSWDFNVPKQFTLVFSNLGEGPADGATIQDYAVGSSPLGGVDYVTYNSAAVLSCVADGGAVCPGLSAFAAPLAGSIPRNTLSGTGVALFSAKVPVWPKGGTLKVVYQLTPTAYTRPTCGASPSSSMRIQNTGSVTVPTGMSDPVIGNNSSAITATGPSVPWPNCPQADLQTIVSPANSTVIFGEPYQVQFKFRNLGPAAADASYVTALRSIAPPSATPAGGITHIEYTNGSVTCTSTAGTSCPTPVFPATGAIDTVDASFLGSNLIADNWPAGGEFTFTLTFTPTGYRGICSGVNARARFYWTGKTNIASGVVDPVSGNNNSLISSAMGPLCADLAVRKDVASATTSTGANNSFTIDVTLPSAYAAVSNAVVEDIVPSGFIYDGSEASTICSVTAGTATCGAPNWDPVTRKFSAVIPLMQPGSTVRYELIGKAVDYSSTWRNTATVRHSAEGWDPNPGTNSSTVSLGILDSLPMVTKQSLDENKAIKVGQNVKYRITVSNPSSGNVASKVTISDTLANGFTYLSQDPIVLAGGATRTSTLAPTPGSVQLQWGTFNIPAGGTVVLTFTATTPADLTCGSTQYHNSARADFTVLGSESYREYDGTLIGNDADDVSIPCVPSLSKSMSPTVISSRSTSTLTFTLTPASGTAPNTLPISFVDNLPSGLEYAGSVVGNTCGAAVTRPDGASLSASDTSIKIGNAKLPDGGKQSCYVSVSVRNRLGAFNADCSTNPAAFTNGAGNISNLDNVANAVGNACMVVNPLPLTMAKSFSPSSILDGETSTASFTFNQPAGHPATVVSLTDQLPPGLTLVYPLQVAGTCNNGATAGYVTGVGSRLSITDLPLVANASAGVFSCSLTVKVTNAPGMINSSCTGNPADFSNGPANISGRSGNLSAPVSPACLVVTSSPKIDKVLSPKVILNGQSTQLIFTITNANGLPAQTGINFTDALPGGWRIADSMVSNTCGGTITPLAAEAQAVTLTGGVLAEGQSSCQIVVNVKNYASSLNSLCSANPSAYTNQNYNFTTSALGNLVARVTTPQCLTVLSQDIRVTKEFQQNSLTISQIEPGTATVNTKLLITNASNVAMNGFEVFDVLPAPGDVDVDGAARESTRRVSINAAITGLPAGVMVEYSTQANPCRSTAAGRNVGGALPDLPIGCTAPQWQSTVTDYSAVRALRFVGTGLNVPANGNLSIIFPLQMEAASSSGDRVANDVSATYTVAGNLSPASVVKSNLATLKVVTASLSGFVYIDTSGNNQKDADEPGLPNFVVTALCTAGPGCVVGTEYSVLTDADGRFSFIAGADNVFASADASGEAMESFPGLLRGTWSLTEKPPASSFYSNTGSRSGTGVSSAGYASARSITSIILPTGATAVNYLFAESLMQPPTLTKTFGTSPVLAGNATMMTWTLSNPNVGRTATLTEALVDNMPAGMMATGTASKTCNGGSVSVNGSVVTLAAGTQIPAATAAAPGVCTISVFVIGTATGTNTIAAGALKTDRGISVAEAAATLTVLQPGVLTVTKRITPASVNVSGNFPFSVTCNSPNATYEGSIPVAAGNVGSTTMSIPAGSTNCQVKESLDSRPVAPTGYVWLSPQYVQPPAAAVVASSELAATITNALVSTEVTLTKTFAPATIEAGERSTATMTLSLPANAPAATVNFTDTLPAGLMIAPAPDLMNSCAASGATIVGNSLQVSDLALPANVDAIAKTCTITFSVTNAANRSNPSCSGNPVDFTNAANNVTGKSSNLTYNDAACLVVTATPMLDKKLTSSVISSGKTSQLIFTITNGAGKPAQSGMNFTDRLPSNWRIADSAVSNTCGGTLTDQAGAALAAGQTAVRLTGGVLADQAESCQIVVNVSNASEQTNANCAANPSAWTNGPGNISATADLLEKIAAPQCLTVLSQDMGIAKSFERNGQTVTSLEAGGATVDTVLMLSNTSDVALTGFDLVDVLPSAQDARGSTKSGTITAAITGLPAGVRVQYSTVANPCRSSSTGFNPAGTLPELPVGCSAPDWQATVSDYSTVRALRFVGAGQDIAPTNGTLRLSFPMLIESSAVAGDRIANNVSGTYSVADGESASVVTSNTARVGIATASLSGKVFGDANQNGVWDEGEAGRAGFLITVQCEAGPTCVPGTVYSMLTDADGKFDFTAGAANIFASADGSGTAMPSFPGLLGGSWSITQVPAPDAIYIGSGSTAGNLGGTTSDRQITAITIPAGASGTGYHFGEVLAQPPSMVKQFDPATIGAGGSTTMTWTLSNPNTLQAATLKSALVDEMPAGMTTNGVASTTCLNGSATANGSVVTLAAGAQIPVATSSGPGQCSVSVNVSATVSATNTIAAGALQTNLGNQSSVVSASLVVQQPGTLVVELKLDGAPAGYVPDAVGVYATCDKPVAGSRYPVSGSALATATTPASITGIPVGATCEIARDTASTPMLPDNYTWAGFDFVQPGGAMTEGGALTASITAKMSPLDPPFAQKSGKLIDKKTIEWTMLLANNLAANAGKAPVKFQLHDPLPAASGMSYVNGSVVCTPFGAGKTVVTRCDYDLASKTLMVDGELAYSASSSGAASPERIQVVFRAEASQTGKLTNTATVILSGVSDSVVSMQGSVDVQKSVSITEIPVWDAKALLAVQVLMVLLALAYLSQRRARR